MSLYLDTSVLVAVLTPEAHSPRLQLWLQTRYSTRLLISDWVTTEFSAAISVKVRSRLIDIKGRAEALLEYTRLSMTSFVVLQVDPAHFKTAAEMADRCSIGLRGGDALHLAVCAAHGATLCTLDKGMHEAAEILGIRSEIP